MSQTITDEETMSLEKALKEIHFYRGIVPIKAYEYLTSHQNEATPYLIQILKNVVQRHDRTGDYYVAHIHALLLLSQFREKLAYPILIELLNLPADAIDRVLGDMFTDTMPKIMTSVYDGNPEPLFALLVKHDVDKILRLVIGSCFTALIHQKMIDKEMFLLRMQEIIASGKMNEDQSFFTALAIITMECKLKPLYDSIRAAFKAGMILNNYLDIHHFEKNINRPIEESIRENDLNPITDAAKELGKWFSKGTPITPKIERNALCPCGSGKKFKACCIHYL